MSTTHHPFVSKISNFPLDSSSIVVRGASLTTIITTLERILPEIESSKFKYERNPDGNNGEEKAQFTIEYGTLPKIRTLSADQRNYYYDFENILLDACSRALEWFPHNSNADEYRLHDEGCMPGPPVMPRCWCMTDINILFNQPSAPDAIILEFYRFAGDKYTKYWISRYVKTRFEQEMRQVSNRKYYLSLMEGCPNATGHIARYLFDENVAHDICSYMEHPHTMPLANYGLTMMKTI